jgi:hypothetical protein
VRDPLEAGAAELEQLALEQEALAARSALAGVAAALPRAVGGPLPAAPESWSER